MAFEKKLYGTWLEPVEATITAHLKQPLLREDPVSKRCALFPVFEFFNGTERGCAYFHCLMQASQKVSTGLVA